MIEFATLFLGLVFGPQQVEILVHERVAAVEIYLDHEPVGHLRQAPWRLAVDFGEELAPHVLRAVAFDSSGTELDRVEQWINLQSQQTDVSILVSHRMDGGGLRARVSWESVTEHLDPQRVGIELDGEPLIVEDPRNFALPDLDLEQIHFLRVELRFSETLEAVAEAVFGGPDYADEVETELTAVPLYLERRKKPPTVQEMQGWFLEMGESLELKAVEDGQAEIVVVRDLATIDAMRKLHPRATRTQPSRRTPRVILDPPLKKDHSLRFITPVATQVEREGYRYQLFPPSGPYSRSDTSFLRLFSSLAPTSTDVQDQRLADAVAVAGMAAAKAGRRRAVLMIAGPEPTDRSQLEPAAVRRFLQRLHVPMFVWTPVRGTKQVSSWGPAVNISSHQSLVAAYESLSRQLDRQHIVWLEGLHLPQSISLSSAAKGARLVD